MNDKHTVTPPGTFPMILLIHGRKSSTHTEQKESLSKTCLSSDPRHSVSVFKVVKTEKKWSSLYSVDCGNHSKCVIKLSINNSRMMSGSRPVIV